MHVLNSVEMLLQLIFDEVDQYMGYRKTEKCNKDVRSMKKLASFGSFVLFIRFVADAQLLPSLKAFTCSA